jgi:hypothetical protein
LTGVVGWQVAASDRGTPDLGGDEQEGEQEGEARGPDGGREDGCPSRNPAAAKERDPAREHLTPAGDQTDRSEREDFRQNRQEDEVRPFAESATVAERGREPPDTGRKDGQGYGVGHESNPS